VSARRESLHPLKAEGNSFHEGSARRFYWIYSGEDPRICAWRLNNLSGMRVVR
jgi:hypothetical protein